MKYRNLRLIIGFSLLAFSYSLCSAQNHEIDSLRHRLQKDVDDTNKVKDLNALSFAYYSINPDSTILLTQQASALAQTIGWKKGEANAYINEGIGYCVKGSYPKGLEYFLKALTICQQMGNKYSSASIYSNIATIYDQQGDYKKALEYNEKALAGAKEIKYRQLEANTLGNMGVIYREQNDFAKALDYYNQALSIDKELGNTDKMATQLGNIGNIYLYQKDYTQALKYSIEASALNRQNGDKSNLGYQLDNIGTIYVGQKNYKLAKILFDSAMMLAKEVGEIYLQKNVYNDMAVLDSATGNYKTALEDYKHYIICKDSLVNEANTKKTVQTEMTFTFEQKQAAEKAEQDKKDALAEADKRKQNIITWSVLGGLLSVIVFAGFIFRSLRITRKQKKDIEHKNLVIEEKNKDILDSITYAKRLQDAILPPLSLIKQYLPESFVLYKPKDIVAGDFYWMEQTESALLIAAADCTGHGVPGALVSVVCSNALNRTVKEFKITEPGKILDKVRGLVLETFEKSESNVQDGMDISLVAISRKASVDSAEIQWSGAFNSLWYVQNGEMKELPADKQPIGKTDKPLPFNTHNLKLAKSDTLYLFTDGYADQFGGPKGKKFKYKQLSDKLTVISDKPMEEQRQILDKTLEDWKGNLEQVDDVLIIGIKV